MGFLIRFSRVTKDGATYAVHKAVPQGHFAWLGLLLILVTHVFLLDSIFKKLYGRTIYSAISWVLILGFLCLLIDNWIERRRVIAAWFLNREVAKSGKNNFSFSSPVEVWVKELPNDSRQESNVRSTEGASSSSRNRIKSH